MKKLFTIVFVLFVFLTNNYGQFQSVKDGSWNDPQTWSNDSEATAIPDSTTSVVLSHKVTVSGRLESMPKCYDLTINTNGVLLNYSSDWVGGDITVYNNLINYGEITPPYEMYLTVKGDLFNYGTIWANSNLNGIAVISYGNIINNGSFRVKSSGWISSRIDFHGDNPHYIRTYNDSTIFIPKIQVVDSAGYIIVDSIASISSIVNLNKSKIVLPPKVTYPNILEFNGGQIYGGEIIGNGNTIRTVEGSGLIFGEDYNIVENTIIENCTLEGSFYMQGSAYSDTKDKDIVILKGENILNGSLVDYWNGQLGFFIEGRFVNNGNIHNTETSRGHVLFINVDNSVFVNNGALNVESLKFNGECEFSSTDSISIGYFQALDSNTTVTIISEKVVFKDRSVDVNFNGGKLILPSNGGFDATYMWYNKLRNISVEANNAKIDFAHVEENTSIKNGKISYLESAENLTLKGDIEIIENGTLIAYSNSYPKVTINGNIKNFGNVRNHYSSGNLSLEITGNILHDGSQWSNSETKLVGTEDQTITIPNDSAWTGKVILDPMLEASSYVWMKDGVEIPGATSKELVFLNGISPSDYGEYHCIVGFYNSRKIYIGNSEPTPFKITDVVITNLNAVQTKVEWKTTKPASGFIFYAKEDTTSGFPLEAMETEGNVLEHSIVLDSLTTGSTYYFIIDQNDTDWNNVRSGTYSFVAGEVSQGPIAYWKFDETSWNGSANEVKDETGNYNGTSVGAIISESGKFNNAGSFNGSSNYINIGNQLSPSGDMTISAWAMSYGVTLSSQWYNDYIISKGNDLSGTTNSWGLHFHTAENGGDIDCNFMLQTDQELTWVVSSSGAIQKNKWYHVVGVIKADTAYLYLDGELISKKHISGSIAPSNLNVNIGKMERPGTEYFFNGLIDEVKVLDRALTSEEIKQEYVRGAEELKITDVVITNLNATETKVEWKTTVPASGFIFYAEEDTTSGFPLEAMEADGNVLNHSLTLGNLTTGATYYFIIDQHDADWNNVRSGTYSFIAGNTSGNGNGGTFVERIEGMKQLENTPDEENSVYYDASFISNDIAYVVTNHNRLFKTIDGGKTWTNISPEQGTDYNKIGNMPKVHFINENIGAVAFSVDDGANGYDYSKVFAYVWCTTDGGATWSQRFDVAQDQILHLKQVTETVVYVSGAASYGVSGNRWFKKIVRDAATGNYTLSDVAAMPSTRPHCLSADWLDENVGVALGKLNYGSYTMEVFKTTNGAGSWSSIQSNLPSNNKGTFSYSDQSLQMLSADIIFLAYSNNDASGYQTKFFRSNDGGNSWVAGNFDVAPYAYPNIFFTENGNEGILSGTSSDSSKVFYYTEDGGANWTHYELEGITTGQNFYASEISKDGTIWVAGSKNGIWKSGAIKPTINFTISDLVITNLSDTETKIDWKTSVPASGFIFYAENDTSSGFPMEASETEGLVTEHSITLTNLTSGSTYYFIIDQNDENQNIITSSTYSFVAGDTSGNGSGGTFVERIEGIKKLSLLPDEEGSYYPDGSFISKDVAYVVSNHNRLFKTTDGGETWINVSPEQDTDFDKLGSTPRVDFINENIGTVAFSVDDQANGYDYSKVFAYVWCTTDGGATWSQRFDVNQDQILHLKQVTETLVYVSGAAKLGVASYRWFKKIVRDSSTGNYTLSSVTPLPDSNPHVASGDWLNENFGVMVGKNNLNPFNFVVFKTDNGATNWGSIQGNLPANSYPSYSRSDQTIKIIDENDFALTYANKENESYNVKFFRTKDGGSNWVEGSFDLRPIAWPALSFDATGEKGVMVVQYSGTDSSKIFYYTENGGENWTHCVLPEFSQHEYLSASGITTDGTIWLSGNNIWRSDMSDSTVSVESEEEFPTEFALMQNYPNPFNPSTVIEFSLPSSSMVSLKVYNSIGEEVAVLLNREVNAGYHLVNFDASNLSSGIYFYRISAGKFTKTKKMILLK